MTDCATCSIIDLLFTNCVDTDIFSLHTILVHDQISLMHSVTHWSSVIFNSVSLQCSFLFVSYVIDFYWQGICQLTIYSTRYLNIY